MLVLSRRIKYWGLWALLTVLETVRLEGTFAAEGIGTVGTAPHSGDLLCLQPYPTPGPTKSLQSAPQVVPLLQQSGHLPHQSLLLPAFRLPELLVVHINCESICDLSGCGHS